MKSLNHGLKLKKNWNAIIQNITCSVQGPVVQKLLILAWDKTFWVCFLLFQSFLIVQIEHCLSCPLQKVPNKKLTWWCLAKFPTSLTLGTKFLSFMLCSVTSRHVIHVMSYRHVTSCHVMSCHVISRHFMSKIYFVFLRPPHSIWQHVKVTWRWSNYSCPGRRTLHWLTVLAGTALIWPLRITTSKCGQTANWSASCSWHLTILVLVSLTRP